jgi:hypothetical protein
VPSSIGQTERHPLRKEIEIFNGRIVNPERSTNTSLARAAKELAERPIAKPWRIGRSSAHIRNGQSTWLEACGEPATPWGPDWRSEMLTTNLGRKGETVNEL